MCGVVELLESLSGWAMHHVTVKDDRAWTRRNLDSCTCGAQTISVIEKSFRGEVNAHHNIISA